MSSHYIDSFADDFGPEKIIHINLPKSKMKAIVVIDNVALGPSLGGCRMAEDVTTQEVFRLARAMTLKNALSGLPHGGAKSAILADPRSPNKEILVRQFAQSIKELTDYTPGPDMGTDETCMAYIYDEIGRAAGLPTVLGGIPLDELGMTGYGLAIAADVASKIMDLPLEGARVVIQGFGNVGKAAAKFLEERGAKIIATCDYKGAIYNPDGIDVPALTAVVNNDRCVQESDLGEKISNEKMLEIESDIFIPAARPDIFTEENQHLLKTRLVLEGANIPITHKAAEIMHNRGIMIVPDVVANAGGVICAATEYQKMTEIQAYERIKKTIGHNTEEIFQRVKAEKIVPHEAAQRMAVERLTKAMALRAHI
ncbi:MAG: glutamate dehydrogenase [Nitrospinae bacterium CG11_big_fil_rev_8_21_14_0_20_45_15]|nr:MAG: glutamate dehydrogenase [Nitrospinae bacterium CG11_big_fil_rev_8_21_14_0_20_45_15]